MLDNGNTDWTAKILVITNNPDRASFRQRIEIYLDNLRNQGINCTVCCYPKGPLTRWRLLKSSRNFDAVLLHKKRLGAFGASCLRHSARKIIYDFDDAVMFSDKKPDRPSQKRLRDFKRTAKLADLIIAGNVYLAEHAQKFNDNVKILATGLNIGEYDVKINRPNDGKIRLVWIGSKATLPYMNEIKPALEEIGSRLKNVVLRIISDEFIELQNMKVEKCDWSQQTQARDLAECDIGLAPLSDNPFARGKCGFKILQYAAAGLPSIASPVGVNAQIVRNGVNGYHAVAVGDWIEKISALVNNKPFRKEMGLAARQMVRPFDLDVIGRQLVALVKETIQNQSAIDGENI